MSVGVLYTSSFPVLADENEGTANTGQETINISNGQNGTQTSGNTDSNTNQSSNDSSNETTGSVNNNTEGGTENNGGSGGTTDNSGSWGNEDSGGSGGNEDSGGSGGNENSGGSGGSTTTYTPTEAELGASREQAAVNNILKGVINGIQSEDNYYLGGVCSDSSQLYSYGVGSISDSDLASIQQHVQSFSEYVSRQDGLDRTMDIYDAISNYEYPQISLGDVQGEWESLTSDMKEKLKEAIAKQEGFTQDVIDSFMGISGTYNPAQGYEGAYSLLKSDYNSTPPFSTQTNFSGAGAYRGPYTGVRTDLISGGFQDFNSWSERFNHLTRFTSNSMADFCSVGYIKEYHIANVTTNGIQVVDYTSDTRRWRVYNRDTGELLHPEGADSDGYIYTNNPRRQLSMTFNTAGHYRIVAEQEANYYMRTSVSYDICEYLFDLETRNLLYFNERTVSNGSGGAVNLNGEQQHGWIETGDVFNWTINDLGEIETDGSAIQRVE